MATRFQNALSISGTQKLHKIIPVSNGRVKIYETSDADEGEERIIPKNSKKVMVQDLLHPKPGVYVVCKYDNKVWVAIINSYDEEFDDFKVKFLYPSGYNKYYYYPKIEDSLLCKGKDSINFEYCYDRLVYITVTTLLKISDIFPAYTLLLK